MPRPTHVEPVSFISLVQHFLDFLTVSVHTILYERGVYPEESFITAKAYNYPVRQSRHPDLCDWIEEAVKAVEAELLQGTISKVSLVIFSQWDDPLERFVFDLSRFPVVKKQDWYIEFAPRPERQSAVEQKVRTTNMDEQFRAVMAKLAFCKRELEPLPEEVTFNVAMELKDDADAPIGNPQPWVPITPSLQREAPIHGLPAKTGPDVGGVQTTPLRTVEAGEMLFEMWIEESRAKMEGLEATSHGRFRYQEEAADSEADPDPSPPEGFDGEVLGSKQGGAKKVDKGKQPAKHQQPQVEDEDDESLYDVTPLPSPSD